MVIKNFQIEYSNYVDITLKLIKPLTVKYFPSSYLIQFLYLLTKIAREILVHILFFLSGIMKQLIRDYCNVLKILYR